MSWCTSGVGLQVLPFIENCHLGSFHRFSCLLIVVKLNIQTFDIKRKINNMEQKKTQMLTNEEKTLHLLIHKCINMIQKD